MISYDKNKPIIGSIFSLPASGNKGFTDKLQYEMTPGFINLGYEGCDLLSNADIPSSNQVFIKIGYKPPYDLTFDVIE